MSAVGYVNCDDCNGQLIINGFSLHQEPAWCCWDVVPLWFDADRKGTGYVEQPAADGAWGYPQYDGATKITMPLMVSGFWLPDGSRASNEWEGLQANLTTLRDNVFDMRDAGVPVDYWDAELHMPNGDVRTARVRVDSLRPGDHVRALYRMSFALTILTGSFK